MNDKRSASPQNSASTANGHQWPLYLLVTITSGAGAYLSLLAAVFTVNEAVVHLAALTSLICFVLALALVFHRRGGLAFLMSLATAPICFGLTVLYFETSSFQVAVAQKAAEINRYIVVKINDPQPALDRAMRDGFIRKATADDARAFRDAYVENKYTSKNLPVPVSEDALSVTKVDLSRAYVVLKKFTYPSGLLNEYRVVFFIPIGVPEPSGEIGHSAFYDFGTLTVGCTAARTGGLSC